MTEPQKDTIAVLGTGIMGAPMVRNLLRAGFAVHVYNRTPEKAQALEDDGAVVAGSPAEAARGADVLLTMLADADAVMSVIGDDVLATGPQVWVQMSTVGLEGARRLGVRAREHAIAYVDAPVLGTREPAEQGQLRVLASGPDEALTRCEPIFAALGSRTLRLGAAGAGSAMKLVTNTWVLTLVEGVAETLAMAEGLNVELEGFFEAIADGPLDSAYAKMKGHAMIERDFGAVSFPLRWARKERKDAQLMRTAGEQAGLDLPMVEAIDRALARAVAAGHGDQDMAATFLSSLP